MLQQCNIALPQWGIATMPQRIAAIPVSMIVLPQYCCNADAACNALQHCCNTYCRNIEAHCRNAPFVASLRQCYYCKGHCGNALWHCRNNPIFSRCSLHYDAFASECCIGVLVSVRVCRYRLHYIKHYIISLSDNRARDMTVCDFIVLNAVISLCLCLSVVTSTDPMHQSRNLDHYPIL